VIEVNICTDTKEVSSEDLRHNIVAIHLYPEEHKTRPFGERSDCKCGLFHSDLGLFVL
jgi:hypothetical protein